MTDAFSLVAPDLASMIARSSERQRHGAIVVGCALAMERSGLRDPRAEQLLSMIREGVPVQTTDLSKAEELVKELDAVAWDLQEAVEAGSVAQSEYVRAFSKARAAAALQFALGSDSLTASLESLYEAHHALQDLDTLRTAVNAAIEDA